MIIRILTILSLAGLIAVDNLASAYGAPITQRIVHFTASDGVRLDAVLMHPESGINVGAPAIVMHHGGPGGHAARSIGAYRFAAERFAAAGYMTLSPVSRHSSGYFKYVLEDATKDIDVSLEFVASLGFDRIVLMGHSMGSIKITRYQTTHNNPLVKAMVHFAPTADTYDFVGKRPEVVAVVDTALDVVAAGRGGLNLHRNSVDPDKSLRPPAMMATARGRLQTPQALLSWWGPGHPNANSDFFPELTVPQLLLAGTEDPPVPPGRMEELKRLAVNSPRVDYIWYEGGDHYFSFHQDESAADAVAWLTELGLEPGRRVTTKLIDTRLNRSFTADGFRVPYPGIAYLTDGVDRSSSPWLIYVYGLGEQIFEDPLHGLATAMAHRGFEGHAPQLRESGFRGSLTSMIDLAAEDLADVIKAHREGTRPIVFVGLREGILWALEATAQYDIENVMGFIALSPPPDLPEFAKTVLGDDRYREVTDQSEKILANNDSQTFIVEKYFRPPPAVPGSTDAFMMYPETFLDYYGPDSQAQFIDKARAAGQPMLMVVGSMDSLSDETALRQLSRLERSSDIELTTIEDANGMFSHREGQVADAVTDWLNKTSP